MNDFLENLSQNLIQNSLDGILAFDRECRLNVWNPAMERISGLEKSKVLGRCLFDLFPFLKQTGEDRSVFQTLEGKSTVTKERPYIVPETGREGFFEGHYSPVFGESGEVIGGLAIIREITERKRAAESLRESNQALQALIEASPLALIALDVHGKVEMWNSAAERIFGWSEEEVVGRFNPIIPKEKEEDFQERMGALLRGKASMTIEVRRLRKDGSLIDLTLSTAPLRDAQGKIRGVMGILADITERKGAEQALRIKTDQLAAITEAMTSYLKTGNWREASAQILHAALTQTGSASGFIGVLVEGGGLRVFADEGMIPNSHAGPSFLEKMRTYQEMGYLDFTDFNNLFGSVITSGRPLLTNAPSADPRSAGLPKGHLLLSNFLGVPILLEGEVVGMIGVANRPGGYTACQQAEVEVLSQAAGVLYDSYRRKNRETMLEKQRKEAEEALRKSESRFRQVVDSNLIGLVFSDVNGRITEANDAFLQMIGYTREELQSGRVDWKALTPPEYTHLDMKAVNEMTAAGICAPFEKEFILKDGTRIPVMIGAAFLEGSQKDTVGFVLDLTERKRAKQELRKSEIRFQRLFESDLFGIILGKADGTIRDVNNAFLQMVGYTEEDLRAGRINWEAMTPPEYRHLDRQAVVDLLEKGAFAPFEKEYIRKDGSRIPILIGGAALEDPLNDQGICFILDITDRKQADERLRQSEEKYRLLFETNPYPMWVFDLETLAFLAVNRASIRHYGYSREEFLSMTIKE
ncbi:MAG TPA: PAS domain S-box protein, partial [Candidatus Manganitrophaceae bacterium]|nr:PAS domain S-box protein [Candidatus Manganitrophaceae bacterium]